MGSSLRLAKLLEQGLQTSLPQRLQWCLRFLSVNSASQMRQWLEKSSGIHSSVMAAARGEEAPLRGLHEAAEERL